MIADFRFETPLLRTAVRDASVRGVAIDQLDRSETVSLRTVCWLESGKEEAFEAGLEADRTVDSATRVVETDRGRQYQVTHDDEYPGTELYAGALEEEGIFMSGTRRPDHWTVQMRFPDRAAFKSFRDRIEPMAISVQSMHQQETDAQAERYGISDPQREILLLASERGYFDVPRQASLTDLADELDVSSQAASERLRRGLDSLVERALSVSE